MEQDSNKAYNYIVVPMLYYQLCMFLLRIGEQSEFSNLSWVELANRLMLRWYARFRSGIPNFAKIDVSTQLYREVYRGRKVASRSSSAFWQIYPNLSPLLRRRIEDKFLQSVFDISYPDGAEHYLPIRVRYSILLMMQCILSEMLEPWCVNLQSRDCISFYVDVSKQTSLIGLMGREVRVIFTACCSNPQTRDVSDLGRRTSITVIFYFVAWSNPSRQGKVTKPVIINRGCTESAYPKTKEPTTRTTKTKVRGRGGMEL